MLACFGGHLKVAVQLFEQGASLDTRDNGGSCCLHWAVDGGKPGCIQWLLDKGIEVGKNTFKCLVMWERGVVQIRTQFKKRSLGNLQMIHLTQSLQMTKLGVEMDLLFTQYK